MQDLLWITLAAPFAGFLILALSGTRLHEKQAGLLGSLTIGVGFLAAFIATIDSFSSGGELALLTLYEWVAVGSFQLDVSIFVDNLSLVMALIINGVGFVIHCYSVEYMHGEKHFTRFFSHMNLFVFSMNLLVLAADFFFLIVGWALVGLSSYLLIGFYTTKHSAVLAARKAFVMNVIGDIGMMVGAFILFEYIGGITYSDVFIGAEAAFADSPDALKWACLLLLAGAFAKSAQFPLHTWLPDAMEGPTPVSALIHAATMVTAGVYLIVRCHSLFELVPGVMELIVFVGMGTSFMAATIGLVKNDIKQVIAYSTMSQLGYMFVAAGLGYYSLAIFHLMTHAFFKALLFLSAGSVIHGLHGEQDLRRMGGLLYKMPVTFICFMVGALALSGFPLLSGFFSKEAIISAAFLSENGSFLLWAFALLTAFLTAVYTFRVVFLTFYGNYRGDKHPHESGGVILFPLLILATLAVIGGYWGESLFEYLGSVHGLQEEEHNGILMTLGIIVPLAGIYTAYRLYIQFPSVPGEIVERFPFLHRFLMMNWGFDKLYDFVFVRPVRIAGRFLVNIFDGKILDGLIDLFGQFALFWAEEVIRFQNGRTRSYGLLLFCGALFVLSSVFILHHFKNFS